MPFSLWFIDNYGKKKKGTGYFLVAKINNLLVPNL